ncbi:hypothetical protein [Shimia abyssi]|uniref:Inner membrane protein n=1 Tax=Shimia abyssi TaxID=1662395 RepID=A0A2P8F044_9RHOB|nr:hypothetical protein [Shimia abyssi]PSL15090.1 hypothetical protein CLV88_1269 [Shimia abyssi]
MSTSDKNNKPADDQVETDASKTDAIEDAEIVEDSPDAVEERSDNTVENTEAGDGVAGDVEAEDSKTVHSEDNVVSEEVADDANAELSTEEEQSGENVVAGPEPVAELTPEPRTVEKIVERKGGFVPMVLGGLIAAGIGFGVAVYFGEQLGLGADTQEALTALREQAAEQEVSLEEIKTGQMQVAGTAQQALDGVSGISTLNDTATALGVRIDELAGAVATFDARLTDIEKRPLNEGLSAAAIAAYEREVEDLKALVAEQKAEAAELKDNAALSAQAALARSAVTRIIAALDSGAAYRAAIVDFGSATGGSVPDVLESHADTGVITLAALLEAYPESARAALAKARTDKVDEAEGNTLGNFLKTHLGARSVEPKEGTDTDAILSRTEAALREGRLADALSELDTLAEGPKSVMAEWRATANTRLAATQAAEELAQRLNTN